MKATSQLRAGTLGLLFLLVGCDSSSMFNCDNELLSEIASPNGQFKAGVVGVKCGATTSDATWIVLAPSASRFNFEYDKVATFEGVPEKILWVDGSLVIVVGKARQFLSKTSARGVTITYR